MLSLGEAAWSAGTWAASPALRAMLRRRAASGKEIAGRLPERFGQATRTRPSGRLLWLHAASVGEMISALPLVAALPAELNVLFTTGTVTSALLLEERLAQAGPAGRVIHQFVPLDVPGWVRRFLDYWAPDAACFMESELWPNLLAGCRRRGIPAVLINARLSERSASRWGRLPGVARQVLGQFAWVAAQSAADAERLARLGAQHVDAPGNLKLAATCLPAASDELSAIQAAIAAAPRWLAASTHPHDDGWVTDTHRALSARHPGLITAVAPRHPERGAEIGPSLWSRGAQPGPGLWVADRLGAMGLLYRAFPLVVMGKSFGEGARNGGQGGGQNPWEPAQLGCAVICGPFMQNFEEAVARLRDGGGLLTAADPAALLPLLDGLLADPVRLAAMGAAARQVTARQSGVAAQLARRLVALLDDR